eukprot:s4715_g10.t2
MVGDETGATNALARLHGPANGWRRSHFGEIALLTGQLRTAWIMARAYCLTSVLQASAIDHLMAQDPTSICTLIKNFQDMLKLKASLSWADIKQRLDREFDPDDVLRQDLYDAWHTLASQERVRALGSNMIAHLTEDFTCSGDDGLAPAGLITWTRYQLLLSRIQVSQLDQKLLWALLDEDQCGSVSFEQFVFVVYGHWPEETASESDGGAQPSASIKSGKSSKSFKSFKVPAIDVIERKDSSASRPGEKQLARSMHFWEPWICMEDAYIRQNSLLLCPIQSNDFLCRFPGGGRIVCIEVPCGLRASESFLRLVLSQGQAGHDARRQTNV